MAYFVLVSTLALCLATFGVLNAAGGPGFEATLVDAVFFSGPLLVFGIYLFLLTRKYGLREPGGSICPAAVGSMFVWVPNFLVLAWVNSDFLTRILTMDNLSEQTTVYLLVFPAWALSIVIGGLGAAATMIAAGRSKAKQK